MRTIFNNKDRFRYDMGEVCDTFREVLARLEKVKE